MASMLERENVLSREKIKEVDGIIAKSILKFVPKLIEDVNQTLVYGNKSKLLTNIPAKSEKKECESGGNDRDAVRIPRDRYNEAPTDFQNLQKKLTEYHSLKAFNKHLISQETYSTPVSRNLNDMSYTQINTELSHLRSRLDDYKSFLRGFEYKPHKHDIYNSYYMNKDKRNGDLYSPRTKEVNNTKNDDDKKVFDYRAINKKGLFSGRPSPNNDYYRNGDKGFDKNRISKSQSVHDLTGLNDVPKRFITLDHYNRMNSIKHSAKESLIDIKERNKKELLLMNELDKSRSFGYLRTSKIPLYEGSKSPISPHSTRANTLDEKYTRFSGKRSEPEKNKKVLIPSSPVKRSEKDGHSYKVEGNKRKVNFKDDLKDTQRYLKTPVSCNNKKEKEKERGPNPTDYSQDIKKPIYASTPIQSNKSTQRGKENNALFFRDGLDAKKNTNEVKLIDEDPLDYRRQILERQFRNEKDLNVLKSRISKSKTKLEPPVDREKEMGIDLRSHDINFTRPNYIIKELNDKELTKPSPTGRLQTDHLEDLKKPKYDVPKYLKNLDNFHKSKTQGENRHSFASDNSPILDRTDYTNILSNFHKERKEKESAERPFETHTLHKKQQSRHDHPTKDVINRTLTEGRYKDRSEDKSDYYKDKSSSDVLNYTEILEEINRLLKMTERKNASIDINKRGLDASDPSKIKTETPTSACIPKILNEIDELKKLIERKQTYEYLLDEVDSGDVSSIPDSLGNNYGVEKKLTNDCIDQVKDCDSILLTDKSGEDISYEKEGIDKSFQFPDDEQNIDDSSKSKSDLLVDQLDGQLIKENEVDEDCQFPAFPDNDLNSYDINPVCINKETQVDEPLIYEHRIDESCQFSDIIDGEDEFVKIDTPLENTDQFRIDEYCQFPEHPESIDIHNMGGQQVENEKDKIEEEIINEEIITESFESPELLNFDYALNSSPQNPMNCNAVIIDVNQNPSRNRNNKEDEHETKIISYYTEVRFDLKTNNNKETDSKITEAVKFDYELVNDSYQDSVSSENPEHIDDAELYERTKAGKFSNIQYVTIYDDDYSRIKVKIQDMWLKWIPVQLKIPLAQS